MEVSAIATLFSPLSSTAWSGRRTASHTKVPRMPPSIGPTQKTLRKIGCMNQPRTRARKNVIDCRPWVLRLEDGAGADIDKFHMTPRSMRLMVINAAKASKRAQSPSLSCLYHAQARAHQWSSHVLLVTAVAKERAGLMEHPSTGINTR